MKAPSSFWKNAKRVFVGACVLLAGAYLYNGFELWYNQSKYIYHPEKVWTATPDSVGLKYEEVHFDAADGTRLSAWFVPAENPRATVIFCHGNARNVSGDVDVYKMFHELGLSALALDYRGYGKSEGSPDEKGTYLDAEAAWDYVTKTRGVAEKDVIVWGRSLGSGVASHLAAGHAPKALVIEAAFTSLPDVAADLYPHFPVRWLVRFRYDVKKNLQRLKCPVLVVHSHEDELIPMKHGKANFAAAHEPKEYLDIAGPHRGLPYQKIYRDGLESWLDRLLGKR